MLVGINRSPEDGDAASFAGAFPPGVELPALPSSDFPQPLSPVATRIATLNHCIFNVIMECSSAEWM